MSKAFVVLAMLFCHVLDDFFIQSCGFLATGKQRDWWEKEVPNPKYKYDYIPCLFMHSASWAFMMLPIAWYYGCNVGFSFVCMWVINVFLHMFIDDYKANKRKINLIQDQLIHICQIIGTFIVLVIL